MNPRQNWIHGSGFGSTRWLDGFTETEFGFGKSNTALIGFNRRWFKAP